jgi:hypothetical protein
MNFDLIHWGPTDLGANDAGVFRILTVPTGYAFRVSAVKVSADAATAAVNTNYNTLNFMNGSTTVASLANGDATTGTTIPTGTSTASATVTAANARLAAGETLSLDLANTGTGQAIPGCRITVEGTWEPLAT